MLVSRKGVAGDTGSSMPLSTESRRTASSSRRYRSRVSFGVASTFMLPSTLRRIKFSNSSSVNVCPEARCCSRRLRMSFSHSSRLRFGRSNVVKISTDADRGNGANHAIKIASNSLEDIVRAASRSSAAAGDGATNPESRSQSEATAITLKRPPSEQVIEPVWRLEHKTPSAFAVSGTSRLLQSMLSLR